VKRILDFVLRSVVERVVHNGSLLLERILSIYSVSTSSGKTAANNCGDNNSNENSSTNGSGNGRSAGEKVRASLNVVSASVVGALVPVTSVTFRAVGKVRFTSDARETGLSNSVSGVVVDAILGVQASFGVVAATASGIASVNGTIVSVVTVSWSMKANSVRARVHCAGVEIVTLNWINLTSLSDNASLREALVRYHASCVHAGSVEARVACARVGVIAVFDGDI